MVPFLDACKERRQAGLQVEGRVKGSVSFVLSGEMERSAAERVQRQSTDSHLVLLHIPHRLLPHRLFSGPNYLALPPSARIPGPGGPGLPAGSLLLASRLQLVSANGVDGVPGCSRQFSSADPVTPAPDVSSCCSVCLFHPPRMGTRAGNSRELITSTLSLGTLVPVRACQMAYMYYLFSNLSLSLSGPCPNIAVLGKGRSYLKS